MPSIRARLINRYVRSTFRTLPLPEIDPPVLRAAVEARSFGPLPRGVALEPVEGPVQGEWHRPATADARICVLYLHGGGYYFGSPRTHRKLTYGIAKTVGCDVFSLAYRLSPEHRCPAAIDDAIAAFDWMISQGRDAAYLFVGGDSAGGGLTLALMQALKARGGAMPAGGFLYSPWTDLSGGGSSMVENAERDAMFAPESIKFGAEQYAGGIDLRDPRVSPLFGDFTGLPPLMVFASNAEMLLDDSVRMVDKARAAGVDVQFIRRDGLIHVWPIFYPLMPEAGDAIRRTSAFIRGVAESVGAAG